MPERAQQNYPSLNGKRLEEKNHEKGKRKISPLWDHCDAKRKIPGQEAKYAITVGEAKRNASMKEKNTCRNVLQKKPPGAKKQANCAFPYPKGVPTAERLKRPTSSPPARGNLGNHGLTLKKKKKGKKHPHAMLHEPSIINLR